MCCHNTENNILVTYASHNYRYLFRYPKTKFYFTKFFSNTENVSQNISVSADIIEQTYNQTDELKDLSQSEFWCLLDSTALTLLENECCIFHAIAFMWNKKAWLITAPSGTGKTTQYKNWKKCYGEEIQIINGDKPILELKTNGTIWVHPSPWRGKERYGSSICAPLGGIVCLEQGEKDCIIRMNPHDSVSKMYAAFWTRPENKKQIIKMSKIVESMISRYPVWKLINKGDVESAILTKREFAKYMLNIKGETQ